MIIQGEFGIKAARLHGSDKVDKIKTYNSISAALFTISIVIYIAMTVYYLIINY